MTPLERLLRGEIEAMGPIRLDYFMASCLMHPKHGYYATRDPFGAAGDFTTAPEISQMFGELIGLSLAQAWLDQGSPSPFALAELGPGRGTLMADALRATRSVPGFHDALHLHLIEASATLRGVQAETLGHAAPTWHDAADSLPQMPLFLVANEFFDALPIRQFVRDEEGWREHLVGVEKTRLTLGLGAPVPVADLDHRLADTRAGDVVELPSAIGPVMRATSERIANHGGAALIIDYGDWRSLGDTLQAVQGHTPVDILATPGQADLSAHVDFEALAQAIAPGTAHSRLTSQGVYLSRLGITQRAEALARSMTDDQLKSHHAAFHRLTDPVEMGTLFKVMAVYPDTAAPPPGLDP